MKSLAAALAFVLLSAGSAHAVSIDDLIGLSRAGLSDDILIALVESERSVFYLDADAVKDLKAKGLSDRLVLHLLSTRALREEAEKLEAFERRLETAAATGAPAPSAPPAPEVVVIERVEAVAVPVYVPVYVEPLPPVKPAKPVYWGWGGKRRPDAWKEKER